MSKCWAAARAVAMKSEKPYFESTIRSISMQRYKGVSDMKPLVKDPHVSIEQLIDELNNPESFTTAGNKPGNSHAHDVLDALSQRIMRILRKAQSKAATKPALQDKLNELEGLWGVAPEKLHRNLHQMGPQQAARFIQSNVNLINQLEQVKNLLGSEYFPLIAEHEDVLKIREQSYGPYDKPADYLESFNDFIKRQINQSAALAVVVNKLKDLTRDQLREIRLLLDQHGYSEAKLQSAWRNQTNQDIAASIIGYIRHAAIGEALIPFEQRVTQAMHKIYALHSWTPVQRKWLDRLAKQLSHEVAAISSLNMFSQFRVWSMPVEERREPIRGGLTAAPCRRHPRQVCSTPFFPSNWELLHEVVIDQQFVNRVFGNDGGAKRLNQLLDQQLDVVLDKFSEQLWQAG